MTTEAKLVLTGFVVTFIAGIYFQFKARQRAKIELTPLMSFLDQSVCEIDNKSDDSGNYVVHGYYKSRHIHCLFTENFQKMEVSSEPRIIPKPVTMIKAFSQPPPKIYKDFVLTYQGRVKMKVTKPTQDLLFTGEVFEKYFDELIEACQIVESGKYDIT